MRNRNVILGGLQARRVTCSRKLFYRHSGAQHQTDAAWDALPTGTLAATPPDLTIHVSSIRYHCPADTPPAGLNERHIRHTLRISGRERITIRRVMRVHQFGDLSSIVQLHRTVIDWWYHFERSIGYALRWFPRIER